ncbi:hypothetical protein [Pseudomonas sp. Gutcm_11s]|uniref:hypothetical protein n=1 Tax=Pseudomonas sp. Gutcm_11s TaxID=3026088 RepID=UPI0023605A10|nr:hypothetical protein [Pseudomonas sp. Gutcm_11s]MDD0842865.1 hypothetical protein [Pseudomonas sp. Gutcm_11s]
MFYYISSKRKQGLPEPSARPAAHLQDAGDERPRQRQGDSEFAQFMRLREACLNERR